MRLALASFGQPSSVNLLLGVQLQQPMGICLTPRSLSPHPWHRVNVGCGPAEERVLLTGLHAVADIYCENCKTTLGWKYVSTEGSVGGERAVKKLMRVTGMHSPTCFPGLVGLSAMSMGN